MNVSQTTNEFFFGVEYKYDDLIHVFKDEFK